MFGNNDVQMIWKEKYTGKPVGDLSLDSDLNLDLGKHACCTVMY